MGSVCSDGEVFKLKPALEKMFCGYISERLDGPYGQYEVEGAFRSSEGVAGITEKR